MKIHEPDLSFTETLLNRTRTDFIVLHHSAVISPHSIWDVDRWHKKKGWAGVGYHYFVQKDGKIYRGRPINKLGAHCLGYNDISTSICAEGDFNNEKMGTVQKEAIIELLKAIRKKYPKAQIIAHDTTSGNENRKCRGKDYPFDEIVAAVL